jgi:hypothetical protein
MTNFLRRRAARVLDGVRYCDGSARVSTAETRSAARLDRIRTDALAQLRFPR